ncbi:MAG: FtsW/RodA/SpoVE family cell cycle protein [Minisyncoccia bacterium]
MLAIWKKLDWLLICAWFFILGLSLITLNSINFIYFQRQLVWIILSILVMFFGVLIDWKFLIFKKWFYYGLYLLSNFLLLISFLQPKIIRGTKSWLSFYGFQFEPAELAKISIIFLLAALFSKKYIIAWDTKNIIKFFIYTLIPTGLIALQPDLGSAIIVMSVWLSFLFLSGINWKKLLFFIVIFLFAFFILWNFYMAQYQKNRIIGFLFPNYDPLGINYNVIQSKIAIGSGGLFGKGFGNGTQVNLKFLPEPQTDFIFAAYTEQWGLIGDLILLGLLFLIIYRINIIGKLAQNNYEKFIVLGTIIILMANFFLNVGSNLGLLPITGVTFPFFSYGGSSLLTLTLLLVIVEYIKIGL